MHPAEFMVHYYYNDDDEILQGGPKKMRKPNQDIRDKIQSSAIFSWMVAARYGVNDTNFSKLLRKDLSQETRRQIYQIIEELKQEAK